MPAVVGRGRRRTQRRARTCMSGRLGGGAGARAGAAMPERRPAVGVDRRPWSRSAAVRWQSILVARHGRGRKPAMPLTKVLVATDHSETAQRAEAFVGT